jgi:hypothetical protein
MHSKIESVVHWAGRQIKLLTGIAAGVAIGSVASAVVLAAIPDTDGTIHACRLNTTGTVRIIDSDSETCNGTETGINWEQSNPPETGDMLTNLSGADLSWASLQYRNFAHANLQNSILQYSTLTGSDMHGADLTNALIDSSTMVKVDLHDTDLSNLAGHSLFANLNGANLENSDLSGLSILTGAFVGANLTNTDFTNASLAAGTSFDTTDLTSAVLTGTTWSNVICPDSTNSDDNGNTCIGHLIP